MRRTNLQITDVRLSVQMILLVADTVYYYLTTERHQPTPGNAFEPPSYLLAY